MSSPQDTAADSPSTDSPKKSGLPIWAAIILLLPVLAGGAWISYATWTGQSLFTGQPKVLGTNDELRTKMAEHRREEMTMRQASRPDGIEVSRGGRGGFGGGGQPNTEIKVGDAIIVARRGQGANPVTNFTVRFVNPDSVIPPADRAILELRQRVAEQAVADHIAITPEQREKYKDIGGGWWLNLTRQDAEALRPLLTAWESADAGGKPAAEQAVLAHLRTLLPDRIAAHKAATLDRASKLRAIFTEEQIQKFQQMGR
jgi:hypothetical protein